MLKYILWIICIPSLVYGQAKPAVAPAPAATATTKTTKPAPPTTAIQLPVAKPITPPPPRAPGKPSGNSDEEWEVLNLKTQEMMTNRPKTPTQEDMVKLVEERKVYCAKRPLACGDLSPMISTMCIVDKMTVSKKTILDSIIAPLANSMDYSTKVVDTLRTECTEPSEGAFYLATELLRIAGERGYRPAFISILQWVPVHFKNAPPNMLIPMEGSDVAPLTAFHKVIANFYGSDKPRPLSLIRNIELTIANWSRNQPKAFYAQEAWRDWILRAGWVLEESGYIVSVYNLIKELPKSEWEKNLEWFAAQTVFACDYLVTVGQYKNCLDKLQLLENKSTANRTLTHTAQLKRVFIYTKSGQIGEATNALNKMTSLLEPADDFYHWSFKTAAYLNLSKGDFTKARTQIDEFLASKTAQKPEAALNGRSLRVAVLIEQKEYAMALTEALSIDKEISTNVAGVSEMKIWNQLNILKLYVQKKDNANITKWYETLKGNIKVFPSLTYLTSLIETMKAVAGGNYDLSKLDAARQIVGKEDPDIKRLESFVNLMKK